MITLMRRQANGRPIGVTLVGAVAPGLVSAIQVATIGPTSIALSYSAATGSAPVSYTGYVSPHGTSIYSQNSGAFGSTGGTFVGLSSNTAYDLRIAAANSSGVSTTDYSVGVTTLPSTATAFVLALSASTGDSGLPVQLTATPSGGPWPQGEVITPSVAGLSGSFDNTSLTGSGSAAVSFTFTPNSAAGTSGSFSASAPGLINSSGAQSYAINAVARRTTANRFDAVFPTSATVVGSAQTLSVIPNGAWPTASGTVTATVSKGAGSFPGGASQSYVPGTTTPVTLRYQPSAVGEHAIALSNSAGLYTPYAAPLNVFPASNGSPLALSANIARADLTPHQRDTVAGNPAGFSIPNTSGWGEVPVTISAIGGVTAGLWVKLYDAFSSGATTTVGTGIVLNAVPVQVYGPISAIGTVTLLLPAVRGAMFYAELATDAAFTNPIRLANRFSVGIVVAAMTRSFQCGVGQPYPSAGQVISNPWVKTASVGGNDYRYGNEFAWTLNDGSSGSTAGAMEVGRIIDAQLGVMTGINGMFAQSGGIDEFINHDGSLQPAFTQIVSDQVGGKFRYFWGALNGWDNVSSTYPESLTESRTRFKAAVDWIARHFPACAVQGWCSTSGVFGGDGSRPTGYTRLNSIFLDEIEPINPMVVSKEDYNWTEYYSGHATMASRVQYVRASMRLILSAETTAMGGNQGVGRGPTLAGKGTIASGSRVIRLPGNLQGGTSIKGIIVTLNNPNFDYSTVATPAQMSSLFAVYQSGGANSALGNLGKAIRITTAAINTANVPSGADFTIDLTLAGSSGIIYNSDSSTDTMPSAFTVQFAADFGASSSNIVGGAGPVICDDRTDLGIGMGWHLRPKLDISITTV